MSAKHDFWLGCGHHLLDRDATKRLVVTDEFLKVYLARAELVPPPEACLAERSLYDILLHNPRQAVTSSQIAAIADPDARENWEVMIAWRDHLVRHRTLESAYLDIIRRNIRLPQVFIGQLIQVILRNALNDCDDALVLRAAELFFRTQKLAVEGNSIIAWDEEASVDRRHQSPLFALLGLPAAVEADVLSDATASSYWERSDRFDVGLDLTAGQRGSAALGDVIARWISHLLAVNVAVEPVAELRDEPLSWYVGLSADATRIGDAIWNGNDVDSELRARLVGLYRLDFRDPSDVIEKVRGEPVYLLAAMTADEELRLKPQNLVTGLPIRCEEAAN
ncbi:DUF6352 family protein [Bradyrhizobium canariense]|uniref:DUF6352 family protein n=1 Tax=Bradyrhizobium canariense TaxID=255045 RepID=UPI000A198BB9|nr:DUF6352 family protein [Bradyrhizobium canariense]OSI23802.1 hypothetical protein BST65_21130 [Bradyrhizobium canariense]OSI30941.1 hypothetical protein BST66_20715 [Bradyrhizobium canariense]OSI39845.1 hypothetical protein BSZ20_28265 [Bradyrhizobium canariense]OSI48135.1 hypothetical protein BST67_18745 [Bradyrhizobium canariense]OSI50020.1 hypothetical protein BSZ15_33600 [Bradyrhizobium canariense]